MQSTNEYTRPLLNSKRCIASIAVLMITIASVQAQIALRPKTVTTDPARSNPSEIVISGHSMTMHPSNLLDKCYTAASSKGSGNAPHQVNQVGRVLSPGESCFVGSETFQVLSDGRGRYGFVTDATNISSGNFHASRIAGTTNWRINATSERADFRFVQNVADQSFTLDQSVTSLVLPEVAGTVSPANYSLTPTLPTGLDFNPSTRSISGTPTRVTTAPETYTYTATDTDGNEASLQFDINVYLSSGRLEFVDIQYDEGEAVGADNDGDHLFFVFRPDTPMSTRFAPQTSAKDSQEIHIDRIWLAPYFDNQFANTDLPSSAPRDLTVYIHSDQGGQPGQILFAKVIEDPRDFTPVSDFTLNFFELDLSDEGIGPLPDVIHIAYGNAGTDSNFVVTGPAPYTTENVSHFRFSSRWIPLWEVTTTDGSSFNETVVPIRARFSLGGTAAPLRFAQEVMNQSFLRGQPITPLILPEATGGTSPINYALLPALPTGLNFDSTTRTISGTPTEITTAPVTYTYTATDADGNSVTLQFDIDVYSIDNSAYVDIQYDQGLAVGANGESTLFYRFSPLSPQMSTRFAPKISSDDSREVHIDRIWLAPYFFNQFSTAGLPSSAPRDLTVYIYSDEGGQPGAVLFAKVVEDPRIFALASYSLNFFELDLSGENIGPLPDVVHVAYGDAGSDDNVLLTGPAPYTIENVSHLNRFPNIWEPLWGITTTIGDSFNETVVPIRARFRFGSPTAIASGPETLPTAFVVHGSYPNPFRESTRLLFDLPFAATVSVDVLDVMGRRVRRIPEQTFDVGGEHNIDLNGVGLPSGMYLYRVQAVSPEGTKVQTGRFIRIR